MRRAFVVKTADSQWPIPGIFDELRRGRARIGWSSANDQDLRKIQKKVDEGKPLNEAQVAAKRCLGFLNRVGKEDYLLYPNQPERGRFCIAQVTGKYGYSNADAGIWNDFRSFRPCELISSEPVAMYDEIVPDQFRQRLGRPGRFSEVYDTGPLSIVLSGLPKAGNLQDGSNQSAIERIHDELREKLPNAISREFGRANLARNFCRELFDRMGYAVDSVSVQEGPSEAGSDVVVTVGDHLFPDMVEFQIGVQVFSAKGSVSAPFVRGKLNQLLKGWDDNNLHYGTLLTTGYLSDEAREVLRMHNQASPDHLVRLIDGEELADLFLKYFPPPTTGVSG